MMSTSQHWLPCNWECPQEQYDDISIPFDAAGFPSPCDVNAAMIVSGAWRRLSRSATWERCRMAMLLPD